MMPVFSDPYFAAVSLTGSAAIMGMRYAGANCTLGAESGRSY